MQARFSTPNDLPAATANGYGSLAKSLHWVVFALVLIQFAIAWTMPEIRRDVVPETLINLHMSFGMLIMAVVLVRMLWRRANPVAPASEGIPPWQQLAAGATHWLLYGLLLILPILGWAAASARDWTIRVFDLVSLPRLVPARSAIGHTAGDIHVALSWVLLGLIGLHIAAGLYHYFFLRDRVLQRMLPGS